MADDSDDLQTLITKAVQERKALLCLVSDETDTSKEWKTLVDDLQQRNNFQDTTLTLRLTTGSQQAGFLSAVCPINNTPAVIIIENGQVVCNDQHGPVSFVQFQTHMNERYPKEVVNTNVEPLAEPTNSQVSGSESRHVELPPISGRMRLPNNAYDRLREITERALTNGVKSPLVFKLQMTALKSTKIAMMKSTAERLETETSKGSASTLPDEVVDKLLNTPASAISTFGNSQSTKSQSIKPTNTAASLQQSTSSPQPPSTETQRSSQTAQRQVYNEAQASREASARSERERIRAQIARDKLARKESDAATATAQRISDLADLRKSNSTLPNPSSTDIRIQVRTFDGSTIRNTFPVSATIASDVRPWIDQAQRDKNENGGGGSQPYNLKIILAPLPNRSVEAGEEDQSLADLDIRASCTMVMVPVKGFVESYTGVNGGATGLIGSAVSGGYGLVSGAAGMLFGGVRSLLGSVGVGEQQQQQQTTQRSELPGDVPGGSSGNAKMRTLADQRAEDAKRKGKDHQLYNGNQLNFEPRKDEDDSKRD